jgi:hypothetical protein
MRNATYTIAEGQLVRLYFGVPETAWRLPDPQATIDRTFLGDMGGHCWCDVIVLSDGQTILVSDDGETLACIYPSLDEAYGGDEYTTLKQVGEQS